MLELTASRYRTIPEDFAGKTECTPIAPFTTTSCEDLGLMFEPCGGEVFDATTGERPAGRSALEAEAACERAMAASSCPSGP